jgi:hypothetical protein
MVNSLFSFWCKFGVKLFDGGLCLLNLLVVIVCSAQDLMGHTRIVNQETLPGSHDVDNKSGPDLSAPS